MHNTFRVRTLENGWQFIEMADGTLIPMPSGGAGDVDDPNYQGDKEEKPKEEKPSEEREEKEEKPGDEKPPEDDKPGDKPDEKLLARLDKLEQGLTDRDTRLKVFEDRAAEETRLEQEAADRTPDALRERGIDDAFKRRMDRVYGEGTSDRLENEEAARQHAVQVHARDATNYMMEELEAHGIEAPDDKSKARWELAIGTELRADEELADKYRDPTTQKAAITEAFGRLRDGLINPSAKAAGGGTLERLATRRDAVLGAGGNRGGMPAMDHKAEKLPDNITDPDDIKNWYKKQAFDKLDADLAEESRFE